MTKEEALKLARKYTVGGLEFDAEGLALFVALVIDQEREENAKVCEKVAADVFTQLGREHEPYMKATAEDCAMQIRERGQPRRPWVGLTDEEVIEISHLALTRVQAMLMTTAKLKEKNT